MAVKMVPRDPCATGIGWLVEVSTGDANGIDHRTLKVDGSVFPAVDVVVVLAVYWAGDTAILRVSDGNRQVESTSRNPDAAGEHHPHTSPPPAGASVPHGTGQSLNIPCPSWLLSGA